MYQARIDRVLQAMKAMGLEQMIVSDPDSIWYLTGYYVYPFERLFALYLRADGAHKLFLNRKFPVPEAPCWLLPAWMMPGPARMRRSGN